MKSLSGILVAVLLLAMLVIRASGQSLFEIKEVSPGVYSAISDRVAANATIIVNAQDVVVVDTHFSPAVARALIAQLRRLTPKPVRYVINTHRHGDHINGNQAYLAAYPKVEIVAHANTRADIEQLSVPAHRQTLETLPQTLKDLAAEEKLAQSGRDEHGKELTAQEKEMKRRALARQRAYYEGQRELKLTLPTLTFERKLTLQRGERIIELLSFGRAHTRGDAVVYLPREKVIITGDLLADKLWVGGGYPLEYLEALKQLAQLDFDYAIPGHGPVLRGKEHLQRITQLLEALIAQVRRAVQQGLSLEETKKRVDLRADGELITAWNINDGIERAYAELTSRRGKTETDSEPSLAFTTAQFASPDQLPITADLHRSGDQTRLMVRPFKPSFTVMEFLLSCGPAIALRCLKPYSLGNRITPE